MITPIQDYQIALRASGDIPLDEFRKFVDKFTALIGALSEEIAGKGVVTWQLSDLEYGSATLQIDGFAENPALVRRVVAAYRTSAVAVQEGAVIPYAEPVQAALLALTGLINGHVKGLEFLTAEGSAMIFAPTKAETSDTPMNQVSLGSVRGRVQTISERKKLTFVLYDALFDNAVRCTVAADRQELVRGIWGKQVEVTGKVRRDTRTGQPTTISEVIGIDVIEMEAPGNYRRARGILAAIADLPLPEERIRQLRDES